MQALNLNPHGLLVSGYDPALHAKMRADTLNSQPGDLSGCDCTKCNNRGMIAYPREDGSIFTRECDCMRTRRCVWEMEKSGLKNSIRELTFDAYEAKEDWQQILKSGAQSYANNPNSWLLMGGQSGSGKTHLCTAVCRQRLLSGDEVLYMPWRDKIAQIKALSLDSEQRNQLISSFKKTQILYIDDLYKSGRTADGNGVTGADISLTFEIINHRYINHLTTIISTERTPEELVAIDEATGSRIIEQATGHVYAIGRNQNRNYRLRGVVNI